MVDYIKLKQDESIVFQPTNDQSKEKFALWDIKNKTYIREKTRIQTEVGEQEVNKFIRLTDKEKKTKYGRRVSFERDVIVEGQTMKLDITTKFEQKLKHELDAVKMRGDDPLAFTYKMVRGPGERLKTDYDFYVMGKANATTIDLGLDDEFKLTELETNIVNAIKASEKASKASNEGKITILVNNGVVKDRAKEIVNNSFK